jgi:hypothetical protein
MKKMAVRNLWLVALVTLAGILPCAAQEPARPAERIYLRELEGIWIAKDYLDVLVRTRMPHQAARKVAPVVIGIQREGRAYPIVVTNFEKASVQAVLDVEPGEKPGLYRLVLGPDDRPVSSTEVQYIWFRGNRNAEGKFDRLQMAEPVFMKGKWAEYVLAGKELTSRMNRTVIAGKYTDQKGRGWEFSEDGEAYSPDRTFPYELSLNDSRATCEYFEAEDAKASGGKVRYGYAWRAGKLLLYDAKMVGRSVQCGAKAFATLQPLAN